jgi:hypothetical protein
MIRRAFVLAFIIGMLVMGARGQNEAQRSREALIALSKEGSLRPILQVLDKANLSGSLEFSGRCTSLNNLHFPEFPQFHAPATNQDSPLQTLREMFADDPAMRVTQDSDGTIRMVEKGVSTDILNVKIDNIPFESGQPPTQRPIYDANIALMHIFGTPEVESFMKTHKIETIPGITLLGTIGGKIPPEVPHLSGPLYNVTFSQAMDSVLKTFPGIWIYENCPQSATKKRFVYFHFFHLPKLDTGN